MFHFHSTFKMTKFFTLSILLILFSIGCTPSKKLKIVEISNLPIDSVLLKIDEVKNEVHWTRLCSQYLADLGSKTEKDADFKPMLDYLLNRSKRENSYLGLDAYYRFKSYQMITHGKIDTAMAFAYQALSFVNKHDSIEPMHAYHLLGMAFFYKNQQSDSTQYYWSKGYKEAELKKDYPMIMHFSLNLGTYYYNKGNTHNARSLFMRAKEIGIKTNQENPILINNILNTLLDEHQYEEADKFWKANEAKLTGDRNLYKGQLFLINRANLLRLLNRFEEANHKLNELPKDSVKPTLLLPYTRIFVINQIHKNDYAFTKDSFWKSQLLNNAPYFCGSFLRYSNNIKYENIDFYTQKLIEIASDNEQLKLTSFAQKADISKYLGNYFALSNPKKALEFYKKSSQYNDSALTDELKTQQKVIDELNYLSQTYDEIKKKEEIIQKNKHTQKYLIGALILITLVLILSVLVALNYIKIKNIEKIKLQNEQDALIREQELNNRIVEYSKSIIDRNAKLRSEIMGTVDAAPSSMKNQLNQVLKDFQIAGINPIENPNIAKQLIRAKDDWNEQFPGFEELNKTQQRVFVLTMENYRPKEIANVLGVSTQYVRNVKSRLKTKLNLKEDWGN